VNDKPFVIGSLTGEGFYNCSPSFNWKKHLWKKHLDDATIAKFQRELGAMGYKYQFI
jgi:isocitrate lyase